MPLKLSCFANLSSTFLIFALLFTGFKYLINHHLKYSLSLFLILIDPFIEFSGSLGNGK